MRSSPGNYLLVGNSLAVDFVNTRLVKDGNFMDLLRSDADLVDWAAAAGMSIDRALARRVDRRQLEPSALALRASLRELFEATMAGRTPGAQHLRVLNTCLLMPATIAPLIHRDGKFMRPHHAMKSPIDILREVAEDASRILTGKEAGLLRRCASQHCILLFVDHSRAGGRRWCSMELCGNRAKVAAHHQRNHP